MEELQTQQSAPLRETLRKSMGEEKKKQEIDTGPNDKKGKVMKNSGFEEEEEEEEGKEMGNLTEKEQNPYSSCLNPPPSSGEVAAAADETEVSGNASNKQKQSDFPDQKNAIPQRELGKDSSEHRANGEFNSEMNDEVVLVQPVGGWFSSGAVAKGEKNHEADQTRQSAASSFIKGVVVFRISAVCLVVVLSVLVSSFVFTSGCSSCNNNNAEKNLSPGEVSGAALALPPPVVVGIVILGGLLALERQLNIKDKVPPTKAKKKQQQIKSEENDWGAPSRSGKGRLEDDCDSDGKR